MNWYLTKNENFYNLLVYILEKELEIYSKNSRKEKISIVLDIDGTIIDENSVPITPVYAFYKYCMSKGLDLIIITARPGFKENVHGTINMLLNLGLPHQNIYFMRNGYSDQPTFKLHARKDLKNKGYNTLLSIGDNWWDVGEHGGVGVIINKKNDKEILYQISR